MMGLLDYTQNRPFAPRKLTLVNRLLLTFR